MTLGKFIECIEFELLQECVCLFTSRRRFVAQPTAVYLNYSALGVAPPALWCHLSTAARTTRTAGLRPCCALAENVVPSSLSLPLQCWNESITCCARVISYFRVWVMDGASDVLCGACVRDLILFK